MYSFEKARRADADRLVTLWRETFAQAYHGVHTAENIAAYCAQNFTREKALVDLSDDNVICILAQKDQKDCGFYILKSGASPFGKRENIEVDASIELKQIYILASEYGQGLGRQLYDQAVQMARDKGQNTLWLAVSDINHRAKAFYAKLGFVPKGAGPVFKVGTDRLTSTILVKELRI